MGSRFQSYRDLSHNWIMISFFTQKYKEEAERLLSSIKNFDISYYIEEMEDLGSWEKNVNLKPRFIKDILETYEVPVAYVDADAEIIRYPELFDKLDCDFAYWLCERRGGNVSAGGTLYFTPEAIPFINRWIEVCDQYGANEQDALWHIIKEGFEIKTTLLPLAYCQIFDWKIKSENPIIIHHQASRRYRNV